MEQVSVTLIIVGIIFFLIIAANSIKILREYDRGVIFRLGRLLGVKRTRTYLVMARY